MAGARGDAAGESAGSGGAARRARPTASGSGEARPRPWVKVCGITSVADALMAAGLGVDAIGLNFCAESPRLVSRETARRIVAALPGGILRVGVFRNAPEEEVDRLATLLGLDRVQLHGDEDAEYCARRAVPVIRAVRAAPGWDPSLAAPFRLFEVLVDGYDPALAGGTGRPADWGAARRLVEDGYRVILAGGLRAENLAAAVDAVRPAAVDLNSGVESSPGIKDRLLLGRALEALGRQTEIS